ncbi:MAG: hypothetical protein CHACPFDD_01761 [Phycisphaerae bacterium]|nr:hypothetical protein [Phycisphaerae bacterium]
MKTRAIKYAALFLAGGVLLQFGGCVALVADIVVQQVPVILLGLINELLTSGTGTTTA